MSKTPSIRLVSILSEARKLADYVRSLEGFRMPDARLPEDHMGAVLVDTVLQAGLNYATIVGPRVKEVKEIYPEGRRLSGFAAVLNARGAFAVLRWRHPERPRRLQELVGFFLSEGIDTTGDLRKWFHSEENRHRLREIRGVGFKTVDYIGMLIGLDCSAIDRHISAFIIRAGVEHSDYVHARKVVEFAADLLGVSRASFDGALWKFARDVRRRSQDLARSGS